jgi:hypothetical protein
MAMTVWFALWAPVAGAQSTAEADQDSAFNWLFSGFIEGIWSSRLNSSGDPPTARLRTKAELGAGLRSFYGKISGEVEKNWAIKEATGVRLRELWLEWVTGAFDLRIGRQIIIWGQADGVQITDVICPPDYSEFLTRTLEDIRTPVEAVRFRLLGQNLTFEVIIIPIFQPATLAGPDNPWYLGPVAPGPNNINKPARKISNTEIALKLSGKFPGFDLAASIFRTRDDLPQIWYLRPDGGTELEYPRLTVFGLDASLPKGDLVFRAEAAYLMDKKRPSIDYTRSLRADSLKWLVGLDWIPGSDWQISGQLTGEEILWEAGGLAPGGQTLMATLNVQKKFLNQTLTVANMIYGDFLNRSLYDSAKIEYQFADGMVASLGGDIFAGTRGQFGALKDNSQVWLKVKYYF